MSVNVGSAVGYLDLDTSRFTSNLSTAFNQLNVFASRTATFNDKLHAVGSTLTQTGSLLTKSLTVPLVAAGASFVKVTADFDKAMSNVSAISGATGNELLQLRDKAKEMGAKTKFSATEAADAFSYMAMAGWKTNDMLDGIEGIMNLASASGEDLALTSDIVTDALTAFGLSAKDSGHFADVLAAASSNANTNVSMLGESFKYVAPVAGSLGYSAEDVSVALGLMANSGIKASSAGTQLRALMTNLVKPTDNMAAAMKDLGIEIKNQDGSMKPWMQMMQELRNKFSGLTDDQKAFYAATLAGKEGMSGMLAIVNASENDFNKLCGAIDNADGSAQKMSDTMLNNLSGQLTILKSTLESIAISFGEILMPYVSAFTEKIQQLASYIAGLNDQQKQTIVKVAAIATAIGPAMLILGKLATTISGIISIGSKLSGLLSGIGGASEVAGAGLAAVSGPALAVAAAIAGLVAGFVHLYQTNDNVKQALDSAWQSIQQTLGGVFEQINGAVSGLVVAFQGLMQNLQPIIDFVLVGIASMSTVIFAQITGTINGILQALSPFINTITSIIQFVSDAVKTVVDLLTGNFDALKGDFSNLGNDLINIVGGLVDTVLSFFKGFGDGIVGALKTAWSMLSENTRSSITNIVNNIVQWFAELPGKLANAFTAVINAIAQWIQQMGTKIKTIKTNVVEKVVEFFKDLPKNLGTILGLAIGTIAKFCVNAFNAVKSGIPKVINAVVTFFQQLPGKVWNFLVKVVTKIGQWVGNMVNAIVTGFPRFVTSVLKFFQELPGKIWAFLVQVVTKVGEWGGQMVTKAVSAMGKMVSGILNAVKELPGKMLEIGGNIVNGLVNGVKQKIGDAIQAVKDMGQGVVDGFKQAMDIHSPSKVFYAMGAYLDQGLANGIKDTSPLVYKQMEKMASVITNSGDNISTGLITLSKETGELVYSNTYRNINREIDLFFKQHDKKVSLIYKGSQYAIDSMNKEIQAAQNAYDIKIKLMEQEYKAKTAMLDAQSEAEIKALNAQIDALDAEEDRRAKQKEEDDYNKEYREKKEAMDALIGVKGKEEEYEKAKLELAQLVAQREEVLRKQAVEKQKENLRAQIESVREKTQKQKDMIQNEYEAKRWQLEQQKADEIAYLQEMLQKVQEDYDQRKELAEVQTKLKHAEEDKITEKEKKELKTREKELKASIANNEKSLQNFGVNVKRFATQYGEDFVLGFTRQESTLNSFFSRMIERAESARRAAESARRAMSSVGSGAEGLNGERDFLREDGEPMAEGLFDTVSSLRFSSYNFVGERTVVANLIDYDKLARVIASNTKPQVNVNNEYVSPKALDAQEINRQNELLLRNLAFEYGL